MSTEELKPCPFCGSVSITTWVHPPLPNDKEPDAYCQCKGCTTTGPNGTDAVSAIAAWNRRTANSNSPEFDGIKSAAPAAGTVEKDAERKVAK